MEKIVYFDYCALIIILLMLITTILRKMTHGKQNRYFLNFIIVMFVTVVADVFAITLDRAGAGNVVAKHIAHSVYLTAHMATTPCYIMYVFAVTDIGHRMRRHPVTYLLIMAPLLFGIVLMLINPFTASVYYIDKAASDAYTRGKLFIILYIIAVVYVIVGIVHMFRYRKNFTLGQFAALFSVFPVGIGVAVIQFIRPDYVVEMFANAVALIAILETVQRPENLMDADTGLLRHSAFVASIKNADLTSKHMEVIILNILNFNALNEMLGYHEINSMLKGIADRLIAINKGMGVRAEYYHLGMGKFMIVTDGSNFEAASALAEKICVEMRNGFLLNQMTLNLIAGICIVKYPEDIDNVDSLIAFGNDLNKLPFNGGIRYASELYRREYYDIQKDIDRIIESALAENMFEVYYQPIYSVKEHRFNSAEALLRLHNEKYGFISPELFIPAAEKSGAIHTIGSFVIEEVCKFIASGEYEALDIDYIEVNLSVVQCMQNNLAQNILATLKKYNINPCRINLEITETAASYSQKTMLENLRILADTGISFSLDDFGTGYSNMYRVASLPLNIVKLDKSLTNIEDNSKLMIVLKNTIRMIKDMNMKIVVEGIETESMVQQFAELKCDYIQGYFYSKPIPKSEFIKFIENSKIKR